MSFPLRPITLKMRALCNTVSFDVNIKNTYSASRGRVVLRLLTVVVLFTGLGCASGDIDTSTTAASSYYDTLDEWTRSKRVYEQMDAKLFMTATYKSTAFRTAYVEEYSGRFELDPKMKASLREREEAVSEKYVEFFFSAYTPVSEWNDFEEKDSIWRLYLDFGDDQRVSPVEVEKLDPMDPLLREFFPYLDPWSRAYVVRFPVVEKVDRAPGDGYEGLTLTVTGVKGRGVLTWGIDKGEVPEE